MQLGRRGWKVVRNRESDDGTLCVDVFERSDGTFGFEHFRRDVEDGGAWTSVGGYSGRVFDSAQSADDAAHALITWLTQ
ncbi:hypothetical protein WEH80_09000 [Actinomycetes bacterium KLBMP 9759]